MEKIDFYASAVDFKGKSVLILGESGFGKSDLALRLIKEGGKLVSDDRTVITMENDALYASPHENIKGLLEVRGLGIMNFDYVEHSKIALVVELVNQFERMPEDESITLLNKDLPLLKINPFHSSAPLKVKLALTGSL